MSAPGPPPNGTPLWVVIALLAIFGFTMFVSGYLVCRIFG